MQKHLKNYFRLVIAVVLFSANCVVADASLKHYYCTPSDERHFPLLMNLIGSIHEVDYENLGEIAVYDLGMTDKQLDIVKNIKKVTVHKLEMVNPDLCKYFKTCASGRMVKGWFAWKPVVMKQALDIFPYVLYVDAGSIVLKSPKPLFKHIKNEGYFLMHVGEGDVIHCIADRVTDYVKKNVIMTQGKEVAQKLLHPKTNMIDGGLQGVSRKIYDSYVGPMYEAAKDLDLFADDGSSPKGLGAGRHDQTLFSIYAHSKNMKIYDQGWAQLTSGAKIHIHSGRSYLEDDTMIYRARWDVHYLGSKDVHIKYKTKTNFDMEYWMRNSTKPWDKFTK